MTFYDKYILLHICEYLHVSDIRALSALNRDISAILSEYVATVYCTDREVFNYCEVEYRIACWPRLYRGRCFVNFTMSRREVRSERRLTYDYTGLVRLEASCYNAYVYVRDGFIDRAISCNHIFRTANNAEVSLWRFTVSPPIHYVEYLTCIDMYNYHCYWGCRDRAHRYYCNSRIGKYCICGKDAELMNLLA